jgi:hypothetical protein
MPVDGIAVDTVCACPPSSGARSAGGGEKRMRGAVLRTATRSTFSAAGSVREPKDLHAAWASLAAYDSKAAGAFLNDKADRAKAALNAAGFELAREFVVHGGKARSFDGTREVDETDAAYLWLRQADGRSLLAFRGSGIDAGV